MVKLKERVSEYIKASEVKQGEKFVITNEPFYNDEFDNCPLVADVEYKGDKRKFSFNATNEAIMSEQYGDETEKWVGKLLLLHKTKVNFKGEIKDSIKIEVVNQSKTTDEKIAELLQKGYTKEHIKQMIKDGLV